MMEVERIEESWDTKPTFLCSKASFELFVVAYTNAKHGHQNLQPPTQTVQKPTRRTHKD